jgi:Glycosyl transferase family 2
MPAPIALFAYSRPHHLSRTIDALRSNPEAVSSPLYVFSDAARNLAAEEGVNEVRALLKNINGFADVKIILRETNYGLAKSITTGVTRVLEQNFSVIVIEDDVVVSPHFLRFMNDALEAYKDTPRVGSVSGYTYPVPERLPQTFFIKGADCWGWATWRDRWKLYNPNGAELLRELRSRGLERAFNFDDTMSYTGMLQDQIDGKNDSWAVRWHASCFLSDRLILYPGIPLVENIGNDGSGTHAKTKDLAYDVRVATAPIAVGGIEIEESEIGRAAFCGFFRRSGSVNTGLIRRLVSSVSQRLRVRSRVRGMLNRLLQRS